MAARREKAPPRRPGSGPRSSARSSTRAGAGAWAVRSAGRARAGRALTPSLRRMLAQADVLVTTWDSPRFGEDLPKIAPRLRMIAHCGGEVKGRFARPLFARLTITNAPGPMARFVAGAGRGRSCSTRRATSTGIAKPCAAVERGYARFIASARRRTRRSSTGPVGLLGFGRIGRAIAAMLAPFGVRLLVHDPYVPAAVIRRQGGMPSTWRAAPPLAPSDPGRRAHRPHARHPRPRRPGPAPGRGHGHQRGPRRPVDLRGAHRRGAARVGCVARWTSPIPRSRSLPRHPLRRLPGAVLTRTWARPSAWSASAWRTRS
jgi:hypothetical protein